MAKKTEEEKLELLIINLYTSLKNVADFISACPHIVLYGIGVSQYLEELSKGTRQLAEYLLKEEDLPFLHSKKSRKRKRRRIYRNTSTAII